MEKLPKYLNVYYGPLSGPWTANCRARGVKPGEALKEVLQ